jgi:hypothetical protein
MEVDAPLYDDREFLREDIEIKFSKWDLYF